MREKVKIISVLLSAVLLVSLLYLITYGGAVYAGEEESSEKEEKEELIDLEELEQKRTAIKGKYFSEVSACSEEERGKNQMQVETGRVIKYSGYSTNYFEADGNIAWCLEPARGTPASGTYSAVELKNTSDLARAMYYSTGAPGEAALYEWFGSKGYWQYQDVNSGAAVASWDERYSYSHMFLSWIYNDFDYDTAFYGTNLPEMEWYPRLKKDFTRKLSDIRSLPEPSSGFQAYVIDTGNKKQVMGGFTYVEEGKISLKKTSSNLTITSGNIGYGLQDAEYNVYQDNACTDKVGIFKTNASGKSNLLTLIPGTYYVKESKASKGYAVDSKVYKVVITAGEETVLEVKETPQSNPVDLLLEKTDEECQKNPDQSKINQGCASLEGAEFEVRYYMGYYTEDPEKNHRKATRSWILKTDHEGKIRFSKKYKIGGDEFYYNSSGDVVFPLGTVTIKEKEAPKGYLLNDQVYICRIESQGTTEDVKIYEKVMVPEKIIRGDVQLVKFVEDTDQEQDQKTPLKGIIFTLTSKTTGEVYRITTDENGYATTKQLGISERGNLVYDTYVVHESNTPEGLKPVRDFEVTIQEEGQTKYYILEDKQILAPVQLVKVDGTTREKILVKGAEFQLLNAEKEPLELKVHYPQNEVRSTFETDETGTFILPEKLPIGVYYFREIKAPYGYLLGEETEIQFEIEEGHDWMEPLQVVCENLPAKGKIIIQKEDVVDGSSLAGAEFEITAAEDILTGDGTLRLKKDEVAGYIITDEQGMAETEELFPGNYLMTEKRAPQGYVKSEVVWEVEVTYEDQETEISRKEIKVVNQKIPEKVITEQPKKPEQENSTKEEKKEMNQEKNFKNVKTGDDQDEMLLRVIMLMLSAAVLTGGIIYRKHLHKL